MKKLLYFMLAMVVLVLPGIKANAFGVNDFVMSMDEFNYDESKVSGTVFNNIKDNEWWVLYEYQSNGEYTHGLCRARIDAGKDSIRPYISVSRSSNEHGCYFHLSAALDGKFYRLLNSAISAAGLATSTCNDFDERSWNLTNTGRWEVFDYNYYRAGNSKAYTNIPMFYSDDTESINKWVNDGDMSGALNYESIQNMVEPGNQYKNDEGPWLKMGNFDGSGLSFRPAKDAYCTWMYVPQNTLELTDLTLDVVYEHQLSVQAMGNAVYGGTKITRYSESIPLSSCPNSLTVYPAQVVLKSSDSIFNLIDTAYMFGGTVSYNVGFSEIIAANVGVTAVEITGSNLRVTMKLKGKKNGDWVNGPAYFEVVNMLDGSCTEVKGYSDEDGNYTPDSNGKVTDKNGNVTVKNDIDINSPGGGGGGGNSSSSAEGGSASANASVGDITFKFPDKLTVDVNVNGGTGGGGGSGSSSSDSGSKSWLDRLLDGISALIEFFAGVLTTVIETVTELLKTVAEGIGDFLSYLFEGFGLIGVDGGIGDLLQENFSFVPSEVWKLVMFGISGVILVGIVNKFFK